MLFLVLRSLNACDRVEAVVLRLDCLGEPFNGCFQITQVVNTSYQLSQSKSQQNATQTLPSLGGFSDAITTPIAAQASAAQSGVRHLPPGGLTTAAAGRLGLHATHGHTQVVTCHACRIDK
ncbi:hypothetical protein WJX82_006631 [Trebouxia sp. C0006]